MSLYQPMGELAASEAVSRRAPRAPVRLCVLAAFAALALLTGQRGERQAVLQSGSAFVGAAAPGLLNLRREAASRQPRLRPLRAEEEDKVVDAEVLDEEDEDDEEEDEDEFEDEDEAAIEGGVYPEAAYADYSYDETPPESWFKRRRVDRHKVNSVFFDMYAKPKSFFPHKLQPGDTIRVTYLEAQPGGDKLGPKKGEEIKRRIIKDMREVTFDGVILNFRGQYHARTLTMRAMIGKGNDVMGYEMQFPMHSPLVRKIQVLRRGYIGRNKNAYWMRALIGKKNIIPVDKERQAMDKQYTAMREMGRADEIPESEYPQSEWDRYPLPEWKQDMDDWEEEKYAPELVDQRNDYEKRVIGRYKKKAYKKSFLHLKRPKPMKAMRR
mmetsp:Transcript_110272/g.235508  ORF Transcript_110272/g.235508 Transcript_110272/m.235508 type:complete len:382 (+) Transcript_110272:83-1228(+)